MGARRRYQPSLQPSYAQRVVLAVDPRAWEEGESRNKEVETQETVLPVPCPALEMLKKHSIPPSVVVGWAVWRFISILLCAWGSLIVIDARPSSFLPHPRCQGEGDESNHGSECADHDGTIARHMHTTRRGREESCRDPCLSGQVLVSFHFVSLRCHGHTLLCDRSTSILRRRIFFFPAARHFLPDLLMLSGRFLDADAQTSFLSTKPCSSTKGRMNRVWGSGSLHVGRVGP